LAEWHTAQLDLRAIVADAVSSMSQLYKSRGVTLEAKLPAAVAPVQADPDRLMQVMLNLLSNAVKFCDEGTGRVEVRLLERHGSVWVQVEDNGVGISPEDQRVIFEKFRQVGDTLTQKPPGTGLGLAICRQIIAHFGGHLFVESEPGRGSVFSFSLPAVPQSSATAPERVAA
ncbi:MAG TPA: ATP-binding protein, partial [Usitatibacter sp.]|nr:ATP-binding protein [Usitatibacter sp.]